MDTNKFSIGHIQKSDNIQKRLFILLTYETYWRFKHLGRHNLPIQNIKVLKYLYIMYASEQKKTFIVPST